jgi:hypothetical protein
VVRVIEGVEGQVDEMLLDVRFGTARTRHGSGRGRRRAFRGRSERARRQGTVRARQGRQTHVRVLHRQEGRKTAPSAELVSVARDRSAGSRRRQGARLHRVLLARLVGSLHGPGQDARNRDALPSR